MITALLGGVITGLIISFSTGPVFFTLLQISVDKGFKKAIYFILGTSFTDITMVLVIWYGLNQIGIESDNTLVSLVGAAVLILFGLSFVFKKTTKPSDKGTNEDTSILGNASLFVKAILLDILNPLVWAFWAAVVEYSLSNYTSNLTQLSYFVGILSVIFATDVLKSHFAQRLKSILSERNMKYFNYGIGILLIGFGFKLLYSAFI